MGWLDAAEGLLSGPRGRRLCWTLLDAGDHPGWARVRQGGFAGDLTGLTRKLATCVSLADLAHIAATIDDLALLTALAETVDRARYWGAPDKEDRALSDPAVQEAFAARRRGRHWHSGCTVVANPGRDRQPAVRGVARRARQPARLDRRRRRTCRLANYDHRR
jgi:hypothetical protein